MHESLGVKGSFATDAMWAGAYGGTARTAKRHYAEPNGSGYAQGSPYGRRDQGEQGQTYISEVPGGEPVEVGRKPFRNGPENLVASLGQRIQRRRRELQRDVKALRALTGAAEDDVWLDAYDALKTSRPRRVQRAIENHSGTVGRDHPAVQTMRGVLDYLRGKGPGPRPELVELVRQRGGPVWARAFGSPSQRSARIINPQPSGAGADYRKSRTFHDLEPAAVGTQPRDTRRSRRGYDESLEVAAPDARVRVDAPVRGVTDQRAQQSQYDLEEYGRNAGDAVAKPVLDTDSQIWAPGAGQQGGKKVSAVTALRYVQAVANAGLRVGDPYQLAAIAQRLPHAVIVDRTKLLEAIAQNNAARAHQARRQQRTAARPPVCGTPVFTRYGAIGGAAGSVADYALHI
jgi:hypothetical protein